MNKLHKIEPFGDFPSVALAWDASSPAPGLLAAGGSLDVGSLCKAYRQGIFPWFSQGQPILWWSPDPRMVLQTSQFRLHPSLRKTLQKISRLPGTEIRFDTAFEQVIQACARQEQVAQHANGTKREPATQESPGTWILPSVVQAYTALHRAGFAHSVETWVNGQLVGGLYCVAIGQAVFGESMFSRQTDASKIALSALVAFCRAHGIAQIDCQQNTRHLASLGAQEMPRTAFLAAIARAQAQPAPLWKFDPLYWQNLLQKPASATPTPTQSAP